MLPLWLFVILLQWPQVPQSYFGFNSETPAKWSVTLHLQIFIEIQSTWRVCLFFFFFYCGKITANRIGFKVQGLNFKLSCFLSSFSGLVNVIFLPYNCNIFYTLNEHALTYTSFCEHCLIRDKIGGHYKPARRRLYLPSWRSRPCHQYFPWAPPFKVIRPPKKILNKRMNT